MVGYPEVARILPSLTVEQLLDLRTRIDALLQFASVATAPVGVSQGSSDDALLLECICRVLGKMGVEFTHAGVLKRAITSDFRQKISGIERFLDHAVGKQRLMRQAVLLVGVELLYRNMREIGVPISSRMILRHIHRIPAVLNLHFPGYAEAGLLHKIIQKEVKHVRKKRSLPSVSHG